MRQLSDEDLVKKLKSHHYTDNDEAMNFLYQKMYRKVTSYILKNSGSNQDADDVFQDSLIALYKSAKMNRLEEIKNIQAYFYSICRNLWLKALKKNQRTTALTDEYETLAEDAIQVTSLLSEEKSKLIHLLLKGLGESCQKILIYYYYERRRMKEIMTLMNYSTEQVAKNKKSSCMKKLKEVVSSNPGLKNLLN